MQPIVIPSSTKISDYLLSQGYLPSLDCGGMGRCGRCVVEIVLPDGERRKVLACQTYGPALVDPEKLKRREEIFAPENQQRPETGLTDAEREGGFALAVDLGTTTIAAALISLTSGRTLRTASDRNPQRDRGADVTSRIAAAVDPKIAREMKLSALNAISALAKKMAREANVPEEQVEKIAIAGNTAMEYLIAGIDVAPLGAAPFRVDVRVFPTCSAKEFGLRFAPAAEVVLVPVVSAFIGGDVLIGYEYLLTRGGFKDTETSLLLDVGTNGEMILSDRGKLYAASTAAGPAFEGAQISQGSLAVPGAIAAVELAEDAPRWRVRTIADKPSETVCGSGMIDALAAALELDLIAPSGRIRSKSDAAAREEGYRVNEDGRERAIVISQKDDPKVALTQRDVRQAQLALGAMKVGRRLLLAAAGRDSTELDALYVAGGFGAALSPSNAQRVGLLPAGTPVEKIEYCGNSSLLGAAALLLGEIDCERMKAKLDRFYVVELAEDPRFADAFAEALAFPTR